MDNVMAKSRMIADLKLANDNILGATTPPTQLQCACFIGLR